MRLTIRQIIVISILIVIVATGLLTLYNARYVSISNQHRATVALETSLQARAALLFEARQGGEINLKDLLKVIAPNLKHSVIRITMVNQPPGGAVTIPSDERYISSREFSELRDMLVRARAVTITSMLPDKRYVAVTAIYEPESLIGNMFPIFIVIVLILILLWLCFILYYRNTLPYDVMEWLVGSKQKKHRNDRLIQQLRGHLQTHFNEKTLMITALAHDIKTPLTEAMLRLELLDPTEDTEKIRAKLEDIHNIVRSSLEYAKQPDNIRKVKVDISSLLENIVDNYRDTDFDVALTRYCKHFEMFVELALFRRMIVNLIENARQYATSCEIILEQINRNSINIICQDNGPGVPEQFLELVAVPYFRVNQARTTDGGSGLGLAIVKKIVQLHYGEVTFENVLGGGFKVTITLNRREQHGEEQVG